MTNTADERTDIVRELYDVIPFHRKHGIEIVVVTPRRAETKLPFDESLVGNPDLEVLHGGAIGSLVDLTGAAVFAGRCEEYTPTIDLRVNYLQPAGKQPLYATATVSREGSRSVWPISRSNPVTTCVQPGLASTK
ncbi:PaaI family thioesterase [Natrinema sp. HArc-T2]|uniref:PaaI family thioesterase n=1 Tax=Natrinema sp. HArc-T2 TaxID=3242701 RepID=UPI00359D96E0